MIAAKNIADYAVRLNYMDLPHEVVYASKRAILDTLGCAVGGHGSEASRIFSELGYGVGGLIGVEEQTKRVIDTIYSL